MKTTHRYFGTFEATKYIHGITDSRFKVGVGEGTRLVIYGVSRVAAFYSHDSINRSY